VILKKGHGMINTGMQFYLEVEILLFNPLFNLFSCLYKKFSAKGAEYQENAVNLFEYFTSACYSGYGDDNQSFYSVYGYVNQLQMCKLYSSNQY
jgi:hypothetical protein